MQSMLGTMHSLLSCVNIHTKHTKHTKKQWLCSLNFTNVNIRILIEISYVENQITNLVVSAYFISIFIDLSFCVQGKPYSYFLSFYKQFYHIFNPCIYLPQINKQGNTYKNEDIQNIW